MALTKVSYSMITGAPFNVQDYGATGDGLTDDTAAIQAAVDAAVAAGGGEVILPEPATAYRIISPIDLYSYVTIRGQSKHTRVLRDFENGFAFLANAQNNVVVESLWIYTNTASTANPSGAVGLQDCEYCNVRDVSVVGMRQYGVWLYNSSYNYVENCYFSGWTGGYWQDSCDIAILNDANYNVIRGNNCFGGGDHGILVQDTYAGAQPTGNKIVNNNVGAHTAYGIAIYVTNPYNTKTEVLGNDVKDITGTTNSGATGAGIYIQSAGGTVCDGNTVTNCCLSTTNFFTLTPGAIGVSVASGSFPVIVTNNILSATRGPCIAAVSSGVPVIISQNTCKMNTASGGVNAVSIYVSNSSNCTISDNMIEHTSPQFAVQVIARAGAVVSNTSITNNTITASEYGLIVNRTTTSTHENLRVIGNRVGGPVSQSFKIENASDVSIVGNIVSGDNFVLDISNCIRTRLDGNSFVSANSSTAVILFTGTNTGSICSETNTLVGRVRNDPASGVIVSQYGNAAPVSGNSWNVGDRVIQSVPVVGQPKGWRCTVAGTPGTWVSEGVL